MISPNEEEIADAAIAFAQLAIKDKDICSMIKRQDEIAQTDPVGAAQIQSILLAQIRVFLISNNLPKELTSSVKVSISLIKRHLNGELNALDAILARKYVVGKLRDDPLYYGISR